MDLSFPSLSTKDQERSLKGHMMVVSLSVSTPWLRLRCRQGTLPAVLNVCMWRLLGTGMLTSPRTSGFGVGQSTSFSLTGGWNCDLSTPLGFLSISYSESVRLRLSFGPGALNLRSFFRAMSVGLGRSPWALMSWRTIELAFQNPPLKVLIIKCYIIKKYKAT